MALEAADKAKVVSEYRRADNDTGSPEVQVPLLTARRPYGTSRLSLPNDE